MGFGTIRKIRKLELIIKRPIRKTFKKYSIAKFVKNGDFKNTPIYIISFNRLEYVKQMVEWLKKDGYKNITIIDNHSTYQPLLDYLSSCDVKVIRMKKNYGYLVFSTNIRFFLKRFLNYYVVSDPDLAPVKNNIDNYIEIFAQIMKEYPEVSKVGFSLKIDDIPDLYYLKNEVIEWEKKFYENKIKEIVIEKGINLDLYNAEIDTTFALNSPSIFTPRKEIRKAIRVFGEKCQLRHLPWYRVETDNENNYYVNNLDISTTNWNGNFSKEEIKKKTTK